MAQSRKEMQQNSENRKNETIKKGIAGGVNMNETELEMKERLQQLFITLSEASKNCEAHLLPSITKAMLELYSIFRTIHL